MASQFLLQRDARARYDAQALQSRVDAVFAGVPALGAPPSNDARRADLRARYLADADAVEAGGGGEEMPRIRPPGPGKWQQYNLSSVTEGTDADNQREARAFLHELRATRDATRPGAAFAALPVSVRGVAAGVEADSHPGVTIGRRAKARRRPEATSASAPASATPHPAVRLAHLAEDAGDNDGVAGDGAGLGAAQLPRRQRRTRGQRAAPLVPAAAPGATVTAAASAHGVSVLSVSAEDVLGGEALDVDE